MKKIKYIMLLLAFSGITTMVNAQKDETGIGAFMRSDQRSYVVIAVLLTILAGLILYLVRLEKKISKLERENKQ